MIHFDSKARETSVVQMEKGLTFSHEEANRYPLWKRSIDIAGSLFLLICCLPLFVIIPIIIIVSSGRPIFFVQTRTGVNNTNFRILKFRTMKASIHSEKRHVYHWKEGVPDNFRFKMANDSAVTPFGRLLRKYSLDEMPQLVNVLIGNMSLVGPRPEIPAITDLYSSQQQKRLLAKPGITGFAQIKGRSEINHGKKIEYDLFYIQNRSLLLDFKIITATLVAVIRAKGAY